MDKFIIEIDYALGGIIFSMTKEYERNYNVSIDTLENECKLHVARSLNHSQCDEVWQFFPEDLIEVSSFRIKGAGDEE